jgi:hypothetical protein
VWLHKLYKRRPIWFDHLWHHRGFIGSYETNTMFFSSTEILLGPKLYRVFRLKRKPNTRIPFTHKTASMAIMNSCSHISYCNSCANVNRYGCNFSHFVTRWAHVTEEKLPVFQSFVTRLCIVLYGNSMSGFTLLNASQRTANDFEGR